MPKDIAVPEWGYSGDVNLEYGGLFIKDDEQHWRWGYAEAVEVTDLDSACGADGMVLIEKGTINFGWKRCRKAIASTGWLDSKRLMAMDRHHRWQAIAEAVKSYWGMDVDASEVLQTVEGQPMVYDGWKAEKFVSNADLKGYVAATYLD